jgi:hypothetical protein
MMNVFLNGKMYFATSYRQDEMECLQRVRPPNLLVSFAVWRNKTQDKNLLNDLLFKIGYRPENILVDCGAFTFREQSYGLYELLVLYQEMKEEDGVPFDHNDDIDLASFTHWCFGEFDEDSYIQNKNDFSLFEQYLNFLVWNKGQYDYCFAFDKMGNNKESFISYRVMKALGISVIPVYQSVSWNPVPELNTSDFDILDYYAKTSDYIAIGGTAISKVKGFTKKKRIDIIQTILHRYPNKRFHLLGTLDPYIVQACPGIFSFDGQCWVQKVKKEQKVFQSIRYIKDKMGWFQEQKLKLKGEFMYE